MFAGVCSVACIRIMFCHRSRSVGPSVDPRTDMRSVRSAVRDGRAGARTRNRVETSIRNFNSKFEFEI